ncbi:MAG: hypothetical protein AB7H77_06020 [Bdellovibrionales bacterium]
MRALLRVSVTQSPIGEGTRRVMWLDHGAGMAPAEIYFDLVGEHGVAPPVVLDGFLFGIVLYAMRLGADIHMRGAVSRAALRNVHEFQAAWSLWRPARYGKISVSADTVIDTLPAPAGDKAIAAFSGGADSIFTALRHATGQLGDAGYPLNDSLLLVHGFDVPLDRPDHLEALKTRVKPLADRLGLQLRVIRTNLKSAELQDWEDSFMPQLACCLHNYAHAFRYGLAGSSEPYNALILPWGSNPVTDHLLSGAAFQLVHDGAGFSRTEKIAEIARDALATQVLKVCWEGKETFRNCGVCEKCLRTRLNFLAAGVENPACFDTPLSIGDIGTIRLRNTAQLAELTSVLVYAKAANRRGGWVDALERRIARGIDRPDAVQRLLLKSRNAWKLARRGNWQEIAHKLKKQVARKAA